MGGKSKPQVTTQQSSQEVKPWGPAEEQYKYLYEQARGAFDQTKGQTFGGDFIAGPNAIQQQGVNSMIGVAGNSNAGADVLRNLGVNTANGMFLSPESNPYLTAGINAAIDPVMKNLSNVILPQISDKAVREGAWGGSRQDLQENEAVAAATKEAGTIANSIYFQNYLNERQNQNQAGKILADANTLDMLPSTLLMSAGGQQQAWDQADIQNELAKFQQELTAPWFGMNDFANILSSGGFRSSEGMSTTTQPAPQSNPLGSALQGLLGGAGTGASLASSIGGVGAGAGLSAFAPWMLPLAALGGMTGYMGSR